MSRPTILLIDYEPQSIEATLQPLVEVGYCVEVAKDGVAGIEAFRKLHPDLVLLEMILPRKHGLEVCQELRKSDPGGRTPIVMMGRMTTGTRYRVQALNSGASDFVPKPIEPERLLEICNAHLTASVGPAEPLALEEAGEGAGRAQPLPQAAGSPLAASTDLADLSEDEIIARLEAALPSGVVPTGAVLSPEAAAGPVPAGPEPFEHPAHMPSVAQEPQLASPGPEIPAEWTAPRVAVAKTPAAPRPVEKVAPPPPRAPRPRRRPEPRPVEMVREPPQELSRRNGGPWVWIAGAAVAVAAVYVLVFAIKDPSGGPGAGAEREDRSPPAVSATALENAAAALRDEGRPSESGSPPASEATMSTPAPVPVPSPTRAPRSEIQQAAVAAVRTKPPGAPPSATIPTARQTTDTAPADSIPEPARAEVLPSATPTEPVAEPAPQRQEPPAPVESAPPAPVESAPPAPVESAPPAPEPPRLEAADAAPTSETKPLEAEAPPRPGVVRGAIVQLSDVDSPPAILNRTRPRYPSAALRLRREAVVTLKLLVDETGRVVVVEAESRTASSDFVAEATRAAQAWTYRPAMKDGVPVKVWITEKVTFKL